MNKITHNTITGALIFIVIIIAAYLVVSQKKQIPQETKEKLTNVTIAYLPVVQSLPLYIAIEKGYFTEAGINVNSVKLDSPNLIIDTLLSGQADFGAPGTASGITAIADHRKPGELKIFSVVGGDMTTTNDVLIVRVDSEMRSISDLKGKKLGILPGIQFRTIAKHILGQNNLSTEDDVTIIELAPPLQVQALASKQVDALLTIEPAGTVARVRRIGKKLTNAPMVQFISDPWYGAVGVVRNEFTQEHPEITKKILNIFNRATTEIHTDPNKAKQYLAGYTALDEALIKEAPLPIYKMYSDFTETDITSLQKFFDLFTKYKIINTTINTQTLIYTDQQ